MLNYHTYLAQLITIIPTVPLTHISKTLPIKSIRALLGLLCLFSVQFVGLVGRCVFLAVITLFPGEFLASSKHFRWQSLQQGGEERVQQQLMSKIQTYKYNFIRRPAMTHSQTFDQEDSSKVLRQKIDYINRLPPTTSARNEKPTSEDDKAQLERRYELQLAEVRQEGLRERRMLEARTQQYLTELVDLLDILTRNAALPQEYFKQERKSTENSTRDLEKEYRTVKEKLEFLKPRRTPTQFSLLKHSIINPERDRPRALTLRRTVDLKVPAKQEEHLSFSHSCQRTETARPSTEKHRKLSLPRVEVAPTPLQLMNEKYRHSQEKVRKLQQALNRQTALRMQDEALIHQLNEKVVEGQMELMNTKMKARNSFYS